MKKKIILLGAMDQEVELLRVWSHADGHEISPMVTAYKGEACGCSLLVSKVGVGKVASAIHTQKLIDYFQPDYLVFSGLAGALNADYGIGDLVLGVDSVQHDLDATALGFDIGTVPYSQYRYFEADEKLLELASKFTPTMGKLHQGRILTGDQFVDGCNKPSLQGRWDQLGGDCLEMEGAAVAFCAVLNRVPHLVVRTISDRADGEAEKDFNQFLNCAGRQNVEFLEWFIGQLSNW